MYFDLIIIGAGASGTMAAVSALMSNKTLKLAVVDSNPKVGSKLSITGNGRCNILPSEFVRSSFFGDPGYVDKYLGQDKLDSLIDFFSRRLGLELICDDGRYYPRSNRADSVVNLLKETVSSLGGSFLLNEKIDSITRDKDRFSLNGKYRCRRLIIATGGRAYPVKGSDGSGFELLRDLGVDSTRLFPSLTALEVRGIHRSLDGVRTRAKVSIYINGKIISSDSGELQFTKYGLSGVVVMQVSRPAAPALKLGLKIAAQIELLDTEELNRLRALICDSSVPVIPLVDRLSCFIPFKLSNYVLKLCGIPTECRCNEIDDKRLDKLVYLLGHLDFDVTGVRGWEQAQITSGGVPFAETGDGLELIKVPGAYVCGEICNVDALCGGNNLFWAWVSGIVAGKASAKSLLTENK